MATIEIDNGMNVIDSRDVIARIEELEGLDERDESEQRELDSLKDLAEQAEGCSDWKYGEALIRDSYLEEYAQELAENIGAINKDAIWPNNCINWEQAADELKQDYASVEFDGVTYWIRR